MKIQKHISDKRGNKVYYKYVIVLPSKIIKKLGFKAGNELKTDVKDGKLVVSRVIRKL